MTKKPAKEIAQPPMTDVQRAARGRAVDELQSRMMDLKNMGKAVPQEWTDRLHELADAHDNETVTKHLDWMTTDLPPQEYMTEEITWGTFQHFSTELLDRLTVFATRCGFIDAEDSKALAVNMMKDIINIKTATDSPIVAMNELAKVRARANRLTDAEVST